MLSEARNHFHFDAFNRAQTKGSGKIKESSDAALKCGERVTSPCFNLSKYHNTTPQSGSALF